jgi:hypothetical protein
MSDVVASVTASIESNDMATESSVPFLTNTFIVPVGLSAFLKITLTRFTELPIKIEGMSLSLQLCELHHWITTCSC